MSINIKNPETHKLARELAELTGESMTEAVTEALRERLQRVRVSKRGPEFTERLLAIGRDAASHIREPFRAVDHGDVLYDENGLPK